MNDLLRFVTCHVVIQDGDGMYNLPTGIKCSTCGDRRLQKKKKLTEIADLKIPTKLLEQYRDQVELTRNCAEKGLKKNDPLIVMQALHDRTIFHTKILKLAGLKHDDMNKKAMKIRKALDAWLEENIFIKPQVDGLI